MATIVKSITHLKKLASNKDFEPTEFYIMLNGSLRSSKAISWLPKEKKFWILNEIDGSEQELSVKQLNNTSLTHIGEAIKKNALIKY